MCKKERGDVLIHCVRMDESLVVVSMATVRESQRVREVLSAASRVLHHRKCVCLMNHSAERIDRVSADLLSVTMTNYNAAAMCSRHTHPGTYVVVGTVIDVMHSLAPCHSFNHGKLKG